MEIATALAVLIDDGGLAFTNLNRVNSDIPVIARSDPTVVAHKPE